MIATRTLGPCLSFQFFFLVFYVHLFGARHVWQEMQSEKAVTNARRLIVNAHAQNTFHSPINKYGGTRKLIIRTIYKASSLTSNKFTFKKRSCESCTNEV